MFQGANALMELARKKQRLAIVTGPEGQRLTIRGEDAGKTRIIPVTKGTWSLDLHYKGGQVMLEGDPARRATALIMPKVNAGGGNREKVQKAVHVIEVSGDLEHFLSTVSRIPVPKVEPTFGPPRGVEGRRGDRCDCRLTRQRIGR